MRNLLQEMGQKKTTIWIGCGRLVLYNEADVVATLTMVKKEVYVILKKGNATA